ncbi:MAG: aminoacyl-tRNA hydrolase [Candidatus Muiribacteriota bacterium]
MKLVAGLGNYPSEYKKTRHNIGYEFIDYFKEKNFKYINYKKKFDSLYFKTELEGEQIFFVKPQTLMNNSGYSIVKFCSFYKIMPEDIVVIYDDIDIDFKKLKLNKGRGTGGHNGIGSIISAIGKNFFRIRVGIFSENINFSRRDFVLSKFSQEELKIIENSIYPEIEKIIPAFASGNIIKEMNRVNKKLTGARNE